MDAGIYNISHMTCVTEYEIEIQDMSQNKQSSETLKCFNCFNIHNLFPNFE